MKQVITGILVQLEVTVYNDDWKVVNRPTVKPFTALEADIPEAVLEWVRMMIGKGE